MTSKYAEGFASDGAHTSFHRSETGLGENGEGGLWFDWFCSCGEQGKGRSPHKANASALEHAYDKHGGPEES